MGMPDEPWWKSTVIYQVYPRSFADSPLSSWADGGANYRKNYPNGAFADSVGDGIGDLRGVIDHLDHLVDLGVGTVWLSPFFASPQRDVGYDVSDYRSVAAEYGTNDDARELIDTAHAKGLRVLFDLVLNHTSDEHPWFVESRSSRHNPKADWYVWADGRVGRNGKRLPPNNWRSELQVPRAWQWCEERQQWYLATFLSFQPDLNWHNPEVRAEMFDTVRFWLAQGVDGFRLDIFGSIMHDQALRDNGRRPSFHAGMPRFQQSERTLNTDENFTLAGDLRAVCDEFEGDDRVLIGEVFGPPAVLRRYVSNRGRPGLHLVFLFEFLAARYDAAGYRRLIERFERELPAPLLPTYVLENHDRSRSLSRLGGDLRKARVMATLLCTLRGVPVIYQGQEIGMENRYIPLADADDPVPGVVAKHLPEGVNRRLAERLNRDEVRTPMQWEPGPGAGFCPPEATPWLPIHENHVTRNVATEDDDPGSLLTWYRELLALRRASEALTAGSLTLLTSEREVIHFERRHGREVVEVVANLGDGPTDVRVPSTAEVLARSDDGVSRTDGGVHLPAHTAAILTTPSPASSPTPSRTS